LAQFVWPGGSVDDVVDVHVVPFADIRRRFTDNLAIFDNVLTLGNLA
jgi:hypothetical protein